MLDRFAEIAIIEPVGGHGGMNYYDFGLMDGLLLANVSPLLYTNDKTDVPKKFNKYTYRFFKGVYGKAPKPLRVFRYVNGLLKSLIHSKFSRVKIVHFHVFHYSLLELFSVAISRFFVFRIVITVHDVESFASGSSIWVTKLVSQLSHGIIVHNQCSHKALLAIAPKVSKKLCIIPHGNYLEHAKFAPSYIVSRNRLGISLDAQVVLFFGQIKKVKGLDILLKAWNNVVKFNPKALLIVAGKVWKDDFAYYRNIADQCQFKDSLRFDIRYIPDEVAQNYYAAADLVVLPYRKIYQSGVLLMAMSHGKSVLVSNLPGMTEIIKHGENGFVFLSEDILDLSSTITHILKNRNLLKSVSSEAVKTVSKYHDWTNIGVATKYFYEKTLLS